MNEFLIKCIELFKTEIMSIKSAFIIVLSGLTFILMPDGVKGIIQEKIDILYGYHVFVISFNIISIYVLSCLYKLVNHLLYINKIAIKKRLALKNISKLTNTELDILSLFFKDEYDTIRLPLDCKEAMALKAKGIIVQFGHTHTRYIEPQRGVYGICPLYLEILKDMFYHEINQQ